MSSPDHLSGKKTNLGLRAELLSSIRTNSSTLAPSWRGASLAAVTVMNAALFTAGAVAQNPANPEPLPGKKRTPAKPAPAAAAAHTAPGGVAHLPDVVVSANADTYNPTQLSSPKYTESLLNTPRSISIVPQAVMRDRQATNLRDVMRNISGVTIQAGEGGETPGDNFVIRGYSARTDIFIDGMRDVGGFFRDPFNIEEVEVTKGPGSSVAGRGSAGGTINIVTKKPVSEQFYRGSVSVGTSDFYRGTIDFNQPFHLGSGGSHEAFSSYSKDGYSKDGKLVTPPSPEPPNAAIRVSAVWHETDVAGRDFVDSKRWGIAPSITFGLNRPTQLTLSYSHLDQDNTPDFGLPWVTATNNALIGYRNRPAPVSFLNYYGIKGRDFERIRTDEASAIVTHAFSDEFNVRYALHYGRNSRDSVISAPRFASNDSTAINREFQSRDQVDTVLTNEIDFTFKAETFGLKHTIVAGVEYTLEKSNNYLRSGPAPFADLYDPDYQDPFPGPLRRTGAVNKADTETFSLFLFDTIKMGEKWQLAGGVRYDSFDVAYDMKSVTNVVTPLARTDEMVSWNAALSYKPTPNGTIYAAYGTSFNPSAQGLVLSTSTAPLEPEKTTTLEAGVKWDFMDHRLSVAGAVFHTVKDNARTPGLAGDPPTVLEGEQEINGAEISVTGNITKDWKIIAGYTYLDTEITKSNNPLEVGNRLPGVPEHSFSLWTTYAITPNFQVGAGAQYISTRFANLINTREADSYWTVDAMAAYRVNDHVTLQVNCINLTDEEYIGGLHIAGSFGHFIPGQGRTATVSANFEF